MSRHFDELGHSLHYFLKDSSFDQSSLWWDTLIGYDFLSFAFLHRLIAFAFHVKKQQKLRTKQQKLSGKVSWSECVENYNNICWWGKQLLSIRATLSNRTASISFMHAVWTLYKLFGCVWNLWIPIHRFLSLSLLVHKPC